jgi:hypothetical protein
MIDQAPTLHEPRFLRFTFGALWRAVVIISFVSIIGRTLDGPTPREIVAVPLVVAAWTFGIFILDRWVVRGDQTSGGCCSRSRQFGRTSAPTAPHFVQTMRGPNKGTRI